MDKEDNIKRTAQDLYALHENLGNSFVDLSFNKFVASRSQDTTPPHACNPSQLAIAPSFDFSAGLAALATSKTEEAKLNQNPQQLSPQGGINPNLNQSTQGEINPNLNQSTAADPNFGLARRISANQESINAVDVKGDKEISTKRGIKSPSLNALQGAFVNQRQISASDDVMKMKRTPPRSTLSSIFIFSFRLRCWDCNGWFCSKCAKKCLNEGKKCKDYSLGPSQSRRSKEKHGQGGVAYNKMKIMEPPNLKGQRQSVMSPQTSKQLPKVKEANVDGSRRKQFSSTPPSSPRRHSNYVSPTTEFV